jgi:hypothetical protein
MTNGLRCLVVGIPAAVFPEGSVKPDEAASVRFSELAGYSPLPASLELVVAPLFCTEFDALELVESLGTGGYRGILRIVAPKLPNRQVVLRELRSHAAKQGITLEMMDEP